jgi:hypothetical protein
MSKVSGIQYIDEQTFDSIIQENMNNSKNNLTTNFFNENPKAVSQKINDINEQKNLGKNIIVLQNSYFENKELNEIVNELRPMSQDKNNVLIVEEYAHLAPNKQNIILHLFDYATATCFATHHPDSARLLGAAFRGHSVHYGVELEVKPTAKMKF